MPNLKLGGCGDFGGCAEATSANAHTVNSLQINFLAAQSLDVRVAASGRFLRGFVARGAVARHKTNIAKQGEYGYTFTNAASLVNLRAFVKCMDYLPLVLYFFITIPSAIFHEYMHGWMADQLGDPTARYAGRLTLNPKSHIDPVGTLLLPLSLFFLSGGGMLFAYAKPVPYNPYNLRNQRWGPVAVALAGPLGNFALALIFGLMVQFLGPSILSMVLSVVVYANVVLGVFNCLPIPPLDGSKLLFALLPTRASEQAQAFFERYGIILLLGFIFFLSNLITPVIRVVYDLFTGGQGLF